MVEDIKTRLHEMPMALADAAGDYMLWEALAVSMLPFVMRRSGFDFCKLLRPVRGDVSRFTGP